MKNSMSRIEKRKIYVAVSSVTLILVLCFAAVFAWLAISPGAVAWFASNREVTGEGLAVTANIRLLEFSDTITTVRHTGTTETVSVYKRDTDNLYYKYENDAFALEEGNKIPFSFTGLLPGEYIDITLSYRGENLDGYYYSIAIESVDDSEGKFSDIGTPPQEHSILGLYQICTVTNGTAGTPAWLATYNTSGNDTVTFPLIFKQAAWADETEDASGFVSTTFRLTINTSQYSSVLTGKTTPNMISEKQFSINTIHIYFSETQS